MEKRLCKDMLEKVYIVWNGKGHMQVMLQFHEINNPLLMHDSTLQYRLEITEFGLLTRALSLRRYQIACCFRIGGNSIVDHNHELMHDVATVIVRDYHRKIIY